MSISGSLFIASTALDAFSDSINVAGDNIANLNTVGFKASRPGTVVSPCGYDSISLYFNGAHSVIQ